MLHSVWRRTASRCCFAASARSFGYNIGNPFGPDPGFRHHETTRRDPDEFEDAKNHDIPRSTWQPIARKKEYDPCKQVLDMLSSQDGLTYETNWEQTALKEASENGDLEGVQKLLEKNSSIDKLIIQDQWQRTALMEAGSRGYVEIVKHLLAADSSIQHLLVRDHEEKTALIEASEKGHVEVVKLLLSANATDEHIMAQDSFRCTPLFKAALRGHIDVVKALLDVNSSEDYLLIRDFSETTALYAASVEGHVEIVKLLLSVNASIKHVRSGRRTQPYLWWRADTEQRLTLGVRESTAMAAACSVGHLEVVRLLFAERMKNEMKLSMDLRECLSFACYFNQKEIVDHLLALVSPNVQRIALQGEFGGAVLLEVCRRGDKALTKTLLEMKPHLKVIFDPKRLGRTALSYACEHGDLESVKLMLEVNSSRKHLFATDDFTGNALSFACQKGHVDVVKALLKVDRSKAHLIGRRQEKKANYSHVTPLMLASGEGHVEVVKVLLALSKTPTWLRLRDANYRAALTWAKNGGHQPVIAELLGVGQT